MTVGRTAFLPPLVLKQGGFSVLPLVACLLPSRPVLSVYTELVDVFAKREFFDVNMCVMDRTICNVSF